MASINDFLISFIKMDAGGENEPTKHLSFHERLFGFWIKLKLTENK